MTLPIYLDNNSTTLLDPKVHEALVHALSKYSNPSSLHRFGREARTALIQSKQLIADYFSVLPSEILFTSGATEALNLVMRGLFSSKESGHLIYSSLEHSAVTATAAALKKRGIEIGEVPSDSTGAVAPEAIEAAIRPTTRLIVVMAVNNETGVKNDLHAIAAIAERHGIPMLVDAVAWVGKEEISIPKGVAGFCFSGHKFHGPMGIGCLIWRRSWNELDPLFTGGPQQYGKRAGTENLPAIVGLAAAISCVRGNVGRIDQEMTRLRDLFEHLLMQRLPVISVNGEGARICNTSNLAFNGVDGESMLACLDSAGVAASHGSACSAGAMEPSKVLLAMGLPRKRVESSLRFSLSRMTTEAEVLLAVEVIVGVVQRLRGQGSH